MRYLGLLAGIGLLLAVAGTAGANTVASSTMWFQETAGWQLTKNPDGTYTGIIPMVRESTLGIGDGVNGYDIYARQGANANFNPGGTVPIGADHDAWGPPWTPDTPDWYQYSLQLTSTGWALRNHPGAANDDGDPWYDNSDGDTQTAAGVPMSGSMNWTTMIASETDVGQYISGTGTGLHPGWAAANGGGAGAWDMDWSWGSEVVPLQYSDFAVNVIDLGGGDYRVSLTPVPEPVTMAGLALGIGGLARYVRKRRTA